MLFSIIHAILRLKEEVVSLKGSTARLEDDKKELSLLVESLRDTTDKCGKLNAKLEDDIREKV